MQRICERKDTAIIALFEKNYQRGREVLKNLGLSEHLLVSDYNDIINNNDIDAVWLVSPNSFHGPQSIVAMQAGKHVFCEKPASTKFTDFCKQIELEKANPKLITFVDYLMNFSPMEIRICQMVRENKFGKITQIQINYRHPINIAGDKIWKLDQNIMGDALGMGIIHSISAMVNAMSPQTKPVGVFALSLPAQVRPFQSDPIWNLLLRFDNGAVGFCAGNIDNANGYDAYHNIHGTKGGLIFDSYLERTHKIRLWSEDIANGRWIRALDKSDAGEFAWPDDTATPDSGNVVEHQTEACVGHFIDCIKNKTQSPLSFVNSQVIAEIGWAAQISTKTHKEIRLPLDLSEAATFFENS